MKHVFTWIPLLLCVLGMGVARAEEDPAGANQLPRVSKQASRPADATKALGELITVEFRDVDVREAFAHLARHGHINLVLDPQVKGKTTLHIQEMRLIDALRALGVMNNATVKLDKKSGVVVVRLRKAPAEVVLQLFDVSDLEQPSEEILALLKRAVPALVTAQQEAREGLIYLRGPKADVARAASLLGELRAKLAVSNSAERAARISRLRDQMSKTAARLAVLREQMVSAGDEDESETLHRRAVTEAQVADLQKELKAQADQLAKEAAAASSGRDFIKRIRAGKSVINVNRTDRVLPGRLFRPGDVEARAVKGRVIDALGRPLQGPTMKVDPGYTARMDKYRVALKALAAAGLHAEAKTVQQKIRVLAQERKTWEASRAAAAQAHRAAASRGTGGVLGELRALRADVRGLRSEVQALTGLVRRLVHAEGSDRSRRPR